MGRALAVVALLALCVLGFAAAQKCAGPPGSQGNFKASVQLSFTGIQALNPQGADVNWFNASYFSDPFVCDNNNPSRSEYMFTPFVCPADNYGVTSQQSCPLGCQNNTCKGGCARDPHGECQTGWYDCYYQSQVRWGTPTIPLNPARANLDVKSGWGFYGLQESELPCTRNNSFGQLVHMNWVIIQDPQATANLSMSLSIEGLESSPLQWDWGIVHQETNNYYCPFNFPYPGPGLCCPGWETFCPYGGNPCDEGCSDLLAFYKYPWKQWTGLKASTHDLAGGDQCLYTVTAFFNVTRQTLQLQNITGSPYVEAYSVTVEQDRTVVPFFVNIVPVCTCPAECPPCHTCDSNTGLCSLPKPLGSNCSLPGVDICKTAQCDAQGVCVVIPNQISFGKACGDPKTDCRQSFCAPDGSCQVYNQPSNIPCNPTQYPNHDCVKGLCDGGGACSPISLEGLDCVPSSGQAPGTPPYFPPPHNNSRCQKAKCKNYECTVELLPALTNCTPANVTCEIWNCNASGWCNVNVTGLCAATSFRWWIILAAVLGAVLALILIGALIFWLTASRAPAVAAGAELNPLNSTMAQSPIYVQMGQEGANPMYTPNANA